jgi:prevent-host-death family protein
MSSTLVRQERSRMGHPSRDRPRRSVDLPEAVLEFLQHEHMAKRVTATEAKARILALLDEVASGEAIEITKRGRVVARLVPARRPHALRGALEGVAMSAADDEQLFTTGLVWDVT